MISDHRATQLLSHDFRDLVSEVARSHYDHLHTNLQRLMDFVRGTPLLMDAVINAPRPEESIDAVLNACRSGRRRIAPIRSREYELGFLHDVLSAIAEMSPGEVQSIIVMYGRNTQFQDSVHDFVADTVLPYSTHLRRVITATLTESGDGKSPRLEINTSGGLSQVVVHQGSGDVRANQEAHQQTMALSEAARRLAGFLESGQAAGLPTSEAAELGEIAGEIPREVSRESPSRWTLKAMQERLTLILTASEVADELRPYVEPVVTALIAYLGGK